MFFSKFLGALLILITFWVYYFFRDPERYPINNDSYLVSPADGLVLKVEESSGPKELNLVEKKIYKSKYFYECIRLSC